MLRGEIIVKLGRKQYRLSTGDTAHLKSGIRYRWRNPTDHEAQLLWIGTPKFSMPRSRLTSTGGASRDKQPNQ